MTEPTGKPLAIVQVYRTNKRDFVVNIEDVSNTRREMHRYSSRDMAFQTQRREARRFRKAGYTVFEDDFTAFQSAL